MLAASPAALPVAAGTVVTRSLASAVRVTGADGTPIFTTDGAPPTPWADCAGPTSGAVDLPTGMAYRAIAARIEVRDTGGALQQVVYAAQILDEELVRRLAAAGGAAVTMLGGAGRPADAAAQAVFSTEPYAERDAAVATARGLDTHATGHSAGGRYVRRVDPGAGQPLPFVLSVAGREPGGIYAILIAAVVFTGLLAIAAAWWLARTTTRPLAELAGAVDRVAAHRDLATRVPVRAQDEVGVLAGAFNRMTREMQAYVQALTASRDQVRGHLAILGDTLSSTHDLQRILEVILQTALAATGARAGVVLLLDTASGSLVGQCGEGLNERWPPALGEPSASLTSSGAAAGAETASQSEHEPALWDPAALRVPLGSGLLGKVAATGVPLRGRAERDGPALCPDEPRCRTYVAVPFSAPGQPGSPGRPDAATDLGVRDEFADLLATAGALWPATAPARGVLALYDRLGHDEFDDADLVTLRTFAGQAAVAVDNVRVHEEAQRLSLTDPLTGLWNYRYLKESIRREVERASRFGRMLAVLALDLDRFKEVNDTYGHPAGDAVLAECARRIRAEVREVDLAFRQGGEEFVVLLPETDAAGGATVAERLGAAIRNTPIVIDPQPPVSPSAAPARDGGPVTAPPSGPPISIPVTVSIGIAVYPHHAGTGPGVLDAADDALYAAKAGGRDTFRIAPCPATPSAGLSVDDPRQVTTSEIALRAVAKTPEDDLPRAGAPGEEALDGSPRVSGLPTTGWGGPSGGASGGPHPPRQSRGR
jgi:diguanylate cyclase (GGDEF)-like protein